MPQKPQQSRMCVNQAENILDFFFFEGQADQVGKGMSLVKQATQLEKSKPKS